MPNKKLQCKTARSAARPAKEQRLGKRSVSKNTARRKKSTKSGSAALVRRQLWQSLPQQKITLKCPLCSNYITVYIKGSENLEDRTYCPGCGYSPKFRDCYEPII